MEWGKVKNIIEETLNKLTVEYDEISVSDSHMHPVFLVRTNDSGVLIGQGGEGLRALNLIVKKMVEKKLGEEAGKFLLDVNGYHERRIEEVKRQAELLAERARAFRHSVEMTPMNSYERMVVHTIFADTPDIKTQSEGEGKFRRVVIRYIEGDTENADKLSL